MARPEWLRIGSFAPDALALTSDSAGFELPIRNHGSRPIQIAVAHCGDGKRFVVRADEMLTAFLELEAAIRSRHCHLKYKLISRVQDEELHEN